MGVSARILPERYRDPQLVGRGAMADVYRATDSELARVVAVKLLADPLLDDETTRLRFRREARAAARLSDPGVVTIYDVGEVEGRPYIVMEYLAGGTLERRLVDEGGQPPDRALRWIAQAGAALDHAHALGVVHRDVKPGNLLFDDAGNVHVADFGIASAAGSTSLTATGTVLGTAGYISPEQASGERATAASDRYALGAVAFELLTGSRPFARETATAEAAAHVHAPIPSAREYGFGPAVDDVFRRALAKNPAERYATCADFAAALRAALAQQNQTTRVLPPVSREQPPEHLPPRRVRRTLPRWLLAAALLGTAALALIVLAVAMSGNDKPSKQASPPATTGPQRTTTREEPRTTTREQPRTSTQEQPTTTQPSAAPPPPEPPPPPPAEPPPPPPPAAPTGDAHSLNDQAWALMKQGRYSEALPLLQQAVPALEGAGPGDLYEGYANYNLGYTLLQLGECKDAKHYLNRAKQLEPDRTEVDSALAAARGCGHGGKG
jgi:serine/threonine-protein kinase